MGKRTFYRRWQVLLAVGTVFVAVALTQKYVVLRRESRTRMCKAHISEVSHAIHTYNHKHGCLPPAVVYEDGVAMHSWRVLILEFWQPDLFGQYRMSEPWNSPHNSLLANQMPHQYRCGLVDSWISQKQTTYVAVVGPDTVMRTSEYSPRKLENVADDTLLLVELPDQPRHWMAPDDATPQEIFSYLIASDRDHARHQNYVTAGGLVRTIQRLNDKELDDLCTCAPAK